jgi:hypothetical protein
MGKHVGLWTRIVARLEGDVSANSFDGYRRAGASVYELIDRVEQRRNELTVRKIGPWEADRATQYEFAFAWNAYVLQALGDKFVEAGSVAEGEAHGYLPAVTAQQVAAFYDQVESWVSRANQAASNPSYKADVHLPAMLPHWEQVDPCPRAHVRAMIWAVDAVRGRAEVAKAAVGGDAAPTEWRRAQDAVGQCLAAANSAADYAHLLWDRDPPETLLAEIQRNAKNALDGYYALGQMLAMPDLAERFQMDVPQTAAPVPTRRLPGPGESGFDPWCLTDPLTRPQWQRDADAERALMALWSSDPDPRATLDLHAEIEAALDRGDVAPVLGHYHCCPWAPVYEAMRPVVIGDKYLHQLEKFVLDVSAEDLAKGGTFRREILVGKFHPIGEDVG